ncbi:hypothetical protein [Chitinophaga terrae (ex Kim and Jung 2007)]|jgi:hypothetical protein|uniref:hypothetical protein n=1 Tax=Chitinophaga terrae (ex Kim and Jung 2007) TaxID=408074 RepID=UPI002619B42A|nr:hypothetical protein [Chitinophaga terrae (ex Kim and Jung 2007)]MDQ0109116.1 hypothetical protein [Chitinophaga terrae (ex Kim and Jung 2007)]
MKKYLFGILAVVVAFTGVAFKEAKSSKRADMYVFEFKSSQPYTQGNVQNTSNAYWEYKGLNLSGCANINQKACRVLVSADYVDDPDSPTQLSGVSITATQSGTTAHVTGISGGGNLYSNQAD